VIVVSEDGTSSRVRVRLLARPQSDVTVALQTTVTTEAVVAPQQVILTRDSSWHTGAEVTVTGVDDAAIDGIVLFALTATTASADPLFWYSWSSTQGHGGFTFPSQVVWDLVKARSEHKQKAASHIYVCSLLT
jgi:hypothetical protein